MGELSKLPNIGNVLEQQLHSVGIDTYEALKEVGSKQAWLKIKRIDDSACINKLCAIEGAIKGKRWHNLSNEVRVDLKDFYNNFK